jgi:hypothetical protein
VTRKIFVAIPSASDAVRVATMTAILDAMVDALVEGWAFSIKGYAGINPIASARNVALAEFLASDCEDLVFVDDDVAWESGALTRLLRYPVDFVMGAYPYRNDSGDFPVRWGGPPGRELWADKKTGLLEIDGAGFGFARLSRACVEQMVKAYASLEYDERAAPNGVAWCLFSHEIRGRVNWSEDMNFCRRWRDIGGKVWVDPEILFHHIGNQAFSGRLGDWLRARIVKA